MPPEAAAVDGFGCFLGGGDFDAIGRDGGKLPLLCAVEMPGRISSPAAASESVGGLEAIRNARRNSKSTLRLRLCRGYQFTAPLPMKRTRTADVLMRGRRKPGGGWECKPVGIVGWSFCADTLADYLFVPSKAYGYGASPVRGSIEQELAGVCEGETLMPPAFFTRVNRPQAYGFKDNPFAKCRTAKLVPMAGIGDLRVQRKWVPVSVMRTRVGGGGPVPSEPPPGAIEQLLPVDKPLVEALRELFSDRPIWLRKPLEEQLKFRKLFDMATISILQKTLQAVSYLWSDGPWRASYIRLGFDPRAPENAMQASLLQVIDFRDRWFRHQRTYFEAVRQVRSGKLIEQRPDTDVDVHFRAPPVNRSQLYQLIDIEDSVVKRVLAGAQRTEECGRDGWFESTVIARVRDRMAVKAEILRRTKVAMANAQALGNAPAQEALASNAAAANFSHPRPQEEDEENVRPTKLRRRLKRKTSTTKPPDGDGSNEGDGDRARR